MVRPLPVEQGLEIFKGQAEKRNVYSLGFDKRNDYAYSLVSVTDTFLPFSRKVGTDMLCQRGILMLSGTVAFCFEL
jgi:hypothetical protein